MKVNELIGRLQACDLDAEVFLQIDQRTFASPSWIGIMDTAGLFAEEKEFQLVISSWEPESSLKHPAESRHSS